MKQNPSVPLGIGGDSLTPLTLPFLPLLQSLHFTFSTLTFIYEMCSSSSPFCPREKIVEILIHILPRLLWEKIYSLESRNKTQVTQLYSFCVAKFEKISRHCVKSWIPVVVVVVVVVLVSQFYVSPMSMDRDTDLKFCL